MRYRLGSVAAALVLGVAIVMPAVAASPAEDELKAEIDRLIKELETGTNGIVRWDGADRIAIRPHNSGAAAEFSNARIVIGAGDGEPARVTFDRFEIRRAPGPGNATRLEIELPRDAVLRGGKGEETRLRLKEAKAGFTLDAASNLVRETEIGFASARIEDKKSGDWLSFGPMSLSSSLTDTDGGAWQQPLQFELKNVEFFFSQAPVSGAIDRIAYGLEAGGPNFAAFKQLRGRLEAMQRDKEAMTPERIDAVLDAMVDLAALFSVAKGDLSVEKFVVRAVNGEPLVGFDLASLAGGLTGLSGDSAALRIALRHEGLTIAGMLLDQQKVPRRAVLDFGVEEVDTAALRAIVDLARKLQNANAAQKSTIQQQMLGTAARLHPVFRIYEMAADLPDAGLNASAVVNGSPLAPKGYAASGDVAVRGLEALPRLIGPAPFADYLQLLAEIGVSGTGDDGTPRVKYQLASAPPKWLTINGNDVSAWFVGGDAGGGRVLRPAQPPMSGDDVRGVQRALAASSQQAPQSGRYDGATAAAVARFQRRAGLNVNGVVDAATRQKLGVKNEPDPQAVPQARPQGRPN